MLFPERWYYLCRNALPLPPLVLLKPPAIEVRLEIIIGLAIVGGIAWLFLSGTFNTRIKDPSTLREHELEDVFIELKKKILVTNAYEQDAAYQRLYYRIDNVMSPIMERHRHFVLDAEAKSIQTHLLFESRERHDRDGMRRTDYEVRHDLDLANTQPEVLLYLCFFLWHGGKAPHVGNVNGNTRMLNKILDHLITERKYAPGSFFKGLVAKYGEKHSESGDRAVAKTLLEFAKDQGVGAASIELQYLPKYAQLDGIKSVNF